MGITKTLKIDITNIIVDVGSSNGRIGGLSFIKVTKISTIIDIGIIKYEFFLLVISPKATVAKYRYPEIIKAFPIIHEIMYKESNPCIISPKFINLVKV